MPELVTELQTTMARQDQTGEHGGREPGLPPLPDDEPGTAEVALAYRPPAAEAGRDLHATLHAWAQHLAAANQLTMADVLPRGRPAGAPYGPLRRPVTPLHTYGELRAHPLGQLRQVSADTAELAGWLARHPTWLRTDPAAVQMHDELDNAVHSARRATDRPDVVDLGPCGGTLPDTDPPQPCSPDDRGRQVWLVCPRAATTMVCRRCGTEYDVAARKAALLDQCRDQLLTAVEMSRALPAYLGHLLDGRDLTAAMIRGYAHRGKLRQHVPDPRDWYISATTGQPVRPDPRYKVGDLIDLLLAADPPETRGTPNRAVD